MIRVRRADLAGADNTTASDPDKATGPTDHTHSDKRVDGNGHRPATVTAGEPKRS